MSISTSPAVRTHRRRPYSVWALMVVLVFLGVSAAGGGVAMLAGFTPPDRWLIYLPQGSALQVVYGVTGAALVLLALLPAVRRDLAAAPDFAVRRSSHDRHR